ncbi:response regulator [Patescibacteria group bacterium]|nr:response regulator [Patescibacteria group bacterium]
MNKILILEDEDVLAKIYKKKLESDGFEVIWVRTTNEAEKQAVKTDIDVFLVDHGIANEERSGLDLIPILKKARPDSEVIMLSNFSDFQLEKEAKEAGASDYLLKIDTTPKKLSAYIKKLIS